VFRGYATGVGAHIRRPEIQSLPIQGCSSLPTTGGHHRSDVGPNQLGKWVAFDRAATSVHGDYMDQLEGVKTTLGEVAFDAATTRTQITSEVDGLVILSRVHVGRTAMGLIKEQPIKGQPCFRLDGCKLEDVRIDDSRLKITLAEAFFAGCLTYDQLEAKHASNPKLFLPCHSKDDSLSAFPVDRGMVKCTIVESISWDGAPHPTAEIHGHVVRVPNFGKIYFGEMFVTDHSRRLTMVRFQLGSDDGGEVDAGGGESDGAPYPPN
jgi:hypothetical protein